MKKALAILTATCFLASCATTQPITVTSQSINLDDGINQAEAEVLAATQLVKSGDSKHYLLSKPSTQKIEDFWSVAYLFSPTAMLNSKYRQTFYRVYISEKNGEVIESGIHKGTKMGWGLKLHDRDM